MATKTKERQRYKKPVKNAPDADLPLGMKNYMLIALSFLMLFLGTAMMYGTDDMYSFTKTGLSVIIILAAFVISIYAVLKKFK